MNTWGWQLLGCFEKGVQAFKAGKPIEDCPYKAFRGLNRQRADYWRDGWKQAKNGTAYSTHRDLRENTMKPFLRDLLGILALSILWIAAVILIMGGLE